MAKIQNRATFSRQSSRWLLLAQIAVVLIFLVILTVFIALQATSANTAGSQGNRTKENSIAPTILISNSPTPTSEAPLPAENPSSQENSDGNPAGNKSVCDPVRDQLMITWRQLLTVQEEKTRIQNQISVQSISPDPNRPPTDEEYAAHQAALDLANAELNAAMAAQNEAMAALNLKPGDAFCVGLW